MGPAVDGQSHWRRSQRSMSNTGSKRCSCDRQSGDTKLGMLFCLSEGTTDNDRITVP